VLLLRRNWLQQGHRASERPVTRHSLGADGHKTGTNPLLDRASSPGDTNTMTTADISTAHEPPIGRDEFGRLARELALGFAYWFAFDVVLAAKNIAPAIWAGSPIEWDQELIRFTGAGLLGAVATPLVLSLVRRFPVEGPARWRRAMFHVLSSAALSVALIAASCVLAEWLLTSERRSFGEALQNQMASNVMLLTFCMTGFIAIAHAARSSRANGDVPPATPALTRVAVKTRAGLIMVETGTIDWIETQGNYLILHVGAQRHLIRETSKRFEAMLDPEKFARTHRQTIVAINRILALSAVGSGDATIRLKTGVELRVSRSYRDRLQARLKIGTQFG
jgi:LytTr DNA-binding domain